MKQFKNKTVIVTGGASGIGKTIVAKLVKFNSNIAIADLNLKEAKKLETKLKKEGANVKAYPLDVRDAEAFKQLALDVKKQFGSVDALFNNAGIGTVGDVKDFDIENFDKVIDINLNGVIYGVMAVYPIMIEQNGGTIINIASVAGLMPTPKSAAYAASKHGVVGLSTSLRYEAKKYNIQVNTVCPTFVETPLLTESTLLGVSKERMKAVVNALGKPISPEECVKQMFEEIKSNKNVIVVPKRAKVLYNMFKYSPKTLNKLQKLVGMLQ